MAADVDNAAWTNYLRRMKLAMQLLLVMMLTVFAAAAGGVVPVALSQPVHAAMVDQPRMEMADCEACASEQMQAGMSACGSVCISAAVVTGGVQSPHPAAVSCVRFPVGDCELTGQARLPELTPPKQILS